jgi:prephenate dehydratase
MSNNALRIAIQGYPGSFHSIASHRYWTGQDIELIPADTFDILGSMVVNGEADMAMMAIENSIAGTILQNYRILRESNLWVSGEIYLRIKHQLCGIKETSLEDIKSVSSHPMALYQCIDYLQKFPHWKIIESEDTALSALQLAENPKKSRACIASEQAAELYGLQVLSPNIETNKSNYTRFFVIQKQKENSIKNSDKASIYLRIPDQKGQLLQVLKAIDMHDINMSKLQSFPVVGSFREYFFHLDLEFDSINQYLDLKDDLSNMTSELVEIGLYKRADISSILAKQTNQQSLL